MATLESLTDEWYTSLHEQSEQTRKVYLRSVRQFRSWLAEHHPDAVTPADIRKIHIHGWLSTLEATGRSESTRRVRLIAVRLWLKYVRSTKGSGMKRNPAKDVPLPKVEMQPVPTIADEDLGKLLRVVRGESFLQTRDCAILRLLIDTGMRREELCNIDLKHIDDARKQILLVDTKTNRDRIVSVSGAKAWHALARYRRFRDQHRAADASQALFLSTRVRKTDGYRMSGNAVGEMMKRRCREAGIKEHTPHKLRHTCFGDLANQNTPDYIMQSLGGWTTPQMVRRYTAHREDERARDFARGLARSDRV